MTKNLVLFDIDGVLADDSWRVPLALEGNWAEYFALIPDDTPIPEGIKLAQEKAAEGFEVQYLTGRRLDTYYNTSRWLTSHLLPNPERVTMRGFADRDILARYKAGVMVNAAFGGEFASVHLYEDDPAVVDYVNHLFGETVATLVPWSAKNPAMVKHAKA